MMNCVPGMKGLTLLGLLFAAPSLDAVAAQADPSPVPGDLITLSDSIRALLDEENLPGASVALVLPSGRIWVRGFGVANRRTQQPMTESTLFRVGSISKMFIAAAALQQQERGHLDLQDPLRTVAPDLQFENSWSEEHPVRLIHLLEHTAGFEGTHPAEVYAPHDSMSLRAQIAYHPHSQVARWPPGRFTAYSDPGMNMAAYAVQRAADRPFIAYVDDRLFQPLGMDSITYDREAARRRGVATGYVTPRSSAEMGKRPLLMRPAIGGHASVRDMARFVKMLLQRGRLDGHRVLQPASIRRMEVPRTTLAATRRDLQIGMGLGNYPKERNGFLWHGHAATLGGHVAEVRYLDEHDRGFVALVNGSFGTHERIEQLLADYLTRNLRPPAPEVISSEHVDLAEYEGYYVSVAPRYEALGAFAPWARLLHVRATDLVLNVEPVLSSLDPVRSAAGDTWRPVGQGTFRERGDPIASHAFITTGGEQYLQVNGGGGGSFKRIPTALVWAYWGTAIAALALMASTLLFAVVWIPGVLLGRRSRGARLQLQIWPLLATVGAALFLGGVAVVLRDPTAVGRLFVTPNVYTLSLWIGSTVLPLASGVGVVQAFRCYDSSQSDLVWWHALCTSAVGLLLAGWLAYFGLLGVRVWAY
jgi:CubicO group peptidase (beta-lactamase class C family)